MELRRPLLVAVGAALCLLGGVPGALQATAAPARTVATSSVSAMAAPDGLGLPGSTTTVETEMTYDGRPRSFVLHIPDGLLAPAPLVVALHAHSHTTTKVREITRLEALADKEGFVVAFPGGAGGSWNAGTCCRPSSTNAVDDVAFLDEVIAQTRSRVAIDPLRISITGGSNGGMMAVRYACERAGSVAAVAVVAGPLVADCTPARPVPVLVLHGADDGVIPLAGGDNAKLDVRFPPVEASLEPFRRAGGDVRVQVVPGAGHIWMTQELHGVDATRVIWAWLRDHPLAA